MKQFLITICFTLLSIYIYSQQIIDLPPPVQTGGKPLIETLAERQSHREYTGKEIDRQTLSNLLWAAHGFNRPDKRTTATSQNRQEIDIYVILNNGSYLYDAKQNKLNLQVSGNLKTHLGQSNITDKAALTLVYVANLDKASNREAGFIDTGAITQNVYLFCASEGLGSVVRASFKRPDLHNALKLSENQEITVVQPVGYIK